MIRIGETLRRERERQGLSYEQVEAELRIRTHYLRMIEGGRLGALPGAPYTTAFVREYARFLGLDGDALGREALEQLTPPDETA
jgi:cytoskeletal protein RodZ